MLQDFRRFDLRMKNGPRDDAARAEGRRLFELAQVDIWDSLRSALQLPKESSEGSPLSTWRRPTPHHFQKYQLPAGTTLERTLATLHAGTVDEALAKLSEMKPAALRVGGRGLQSMLCCLAALGD